MGQCSLPLLFESISPGPCFITTNRQATGEGRTAPPRMGFVYACMPLSSSPSALPVSACGTYVHGYIHHTDTLIHSLPLRPVVVLPVSRVLCIRRCTTGPMYYLTTYIRAAGYVAMSDLHVCEPRPPRCLLTCLWMPSESPPSNSPWPQIKGWCSNRDSRVHGGTSPCLDLLHAPA